MTTEGGKSRVARGVNKHLSHVQLLATMSELFFKSQNSLPLSLEDIMTMMPGFTTYCEIPPVTHQTCVLFWQPLPAPCVQKVSQKGKHHPRASVSGHAWRNIRLIAGETSKIAVCIDGIRAHRPELTAPEASLLVHLPK